MENNKTEFKNVSSANLERKPNENIGFYFSSHIKIIDPSTGQVLVQKRGDN